MRAPTSVLPPAGKATIELHGAARIVLREGRAGDGGGRRGGEQGATTDEHFMSSLCLKL